MDGMKTPSPPHIRSTNSGEGNAQPHNTHLQRLIEDNDTFLFDCDGVVWREGQLIDGAVEALQYLRQRGKRVRFVSNNSTKSRKTYLSTFTSLGIEAKEEEILTSGFAAALHLSQSGFASSSSSPSAPAEHEKGEGKQRKQCVVVLGERGIHEELALQGITTVSAADKASIGRDDVGAVVIGWDRQFTYDKLTVAQSYLIGSEEVMFIATNADATFPAASGQFFPGTGALLAALETCTMRNATIVGKPSSLLHKVIEKQGLDLRRCVMVGDRLNTDIAWGNAGNMTTVLVMTGVDTADGIAAQGIAPTFIADSIADFLL